MPFSTQEFFEVFSAYDAAIWPAQVGLHKPALWITGSANVSRAEHAAQRN